CMWPVLPSLHDALPIWRADVLATVFFFIIVTSLFPLSSGPERETLRAIAPGVVWVAALLASMLSLGRIFGNDYQDGTLEQLILRSEEHTSELQSPYDLV